MTNELPFILDFYDKEVSLKISRKYGFSLMDSYRKFLNSKTYRMLSDPKLEMWDFSPDGIFDMWENEQVTSSPQSLLYLRRD